MLPLRTNAPVPLESIAPPLAVTVKLRSVDAPTPVYCKVPPSSTRFAAMLVEAPMALVRPPFSISATLSTPPEIFKTPEKPFPAAALKVMF